MIHTLSFEMPTTYEPPLGTPLYWRDEVTGVLGAAIWAYISHGAEPDNYPAPSADQLALVIAYLRYVLGAPCWRDSHSLPRAAEAGGGELVRLREFAAQMTTLKEVDFFLRGCMAIGLDPL